MISTFLSLEIVVKFLMSSKQRTKLVPVAGSELIPGRTYYLVVKTKNPPTTQQAQRVMELLVSKWGVISQGISIVDSRMFLQFKTSEYHAYQFEIIALPSIIELAGLVITGIGIFIAATEIPTWVWILTLSGVALLIFGGPVGGFIQKRAKKPQQQQQPQQPQQPQIPYRPQVPYQPSYHSRPPGVG